MRPKERKKERGEVQIFFQEEKQRFTINLLISIDDKKYAQKSGSWY
jgi:hypothetical protein